MNEVTALREADSAAISTKAIAIAAHIDTTSENLQKIKDQLLDAGHPYYTIRILKHSHFWLTIDRTWKFSVTTSTEQE